MPHSPVLCTWRVFLPSLRDLPDPHILYLAAQRALGEQSLWWPYVGLLPAQCLCANLMPNGDIGKGKGYRDAYILDSD